GASTIPRSGSELAGVSVRPPGFPDGCETSRRPVSLRLQRGVQRTTGVMFTVAGSTSTLNAAVALADACTTRLRRQAPRRPGGSAARSAHQPRAGPTEGPGPTRPPGRYPAAPTGDILLAHNRIDPTFCETPALRAHGGTIAMRHRVPTLTTLVGIIVASALISAADYKITVSQDRLNNAINEPQNWLLMNGDYGATRYSKLTQINRDSVRNLRMVWALAL